MKTITFFSEKGGMGKTTLSVMFASFLAYRCEREVYVADCDFPNFQFDSIRKRELEIFKNSEGLVPKSRNDIFRREVLKNYDAPYPIAQWRGRLNPTKSDMDKYIEQVASHKRQMNGYFIFDFPGRFLENDIAYGLMTAGLMDIVVCLVDSDPQSIQSAMYINATLKKVQKAGGQRVVILWNKELASERKNEQINRTLKEKGLSEEELRNCLKKDWYKDQNNLFAACGIPVISKRVHNIDVARRDPTPDTPGFIRSTMCWPEINIKRSCPYMIDIFTEIKEFLDNTTDVSSLDFGTEMSNRKI